MDVEGENAKYLLPAFTRSSGIAVDNQWLSWTAAHEKLLTAYAGGSLPDVFMIARAWVAEFALIGAIQPVPRSAVDLLADCFAPGDLAIQGKHLAVPWTLDVSVQYHRTDLLAAAGHTTPKLGLPEWKTMLRAIKKRQGDDFAVLMQLNWPDHLLHLLNQQPDPLLRDRQAYGNFRSDGVRQMLGFYKSLFDEGLAPRVTSIEAADPAAELERGWIAIYPAGGWTRAELLRRNQTFPRERWSVAPMPGGGGTPRNIVAGAVLCVSHTAADPARAWQLVRYLRAPTTELHLHRIAGTLPSRPSVWQVPALGRDPAMQSFRVGLEHPMPNRRLLEWERIAGEVQLVAEQMVRGRLTVDEAAAEMDRRVDIILAKRRWLLDRGRVA